MPYRLAQVKIGRLAAPLDSPQLAAFVEALGPVNAGADAAPARMAARTEEGKTTAIVASEWVRSGSHGVIMHMSVSVSAS